MRVVVQRVSSASVKVEGNVISKIGNGLLILLGIEQDDQEEDVEWLCGKIGRLRIFSDEAGAMNLSVTDVEGEIMVVSQFTLHASTKKGNRPSFIRAARPETAIPLYETFNECMEGYLGKPVAQGIFGAMMEISLVNDGPVTIVIDSRNRE